MAQSPIKVQGKTVIFKHLFKGRHVLQCTDDMGHVYLYFPMYYNEQGATTRFVNIAGISASLCFHTEAYC